MFELGLLDPQWSAPAHGRWVGRDDLDRLRLKDEEQRPLLEGYLDALERDDVPPERPPWARPGWLGGVRAWLEREAARLGHSVIAIEQVKQWSISAVLRVRTDGPDLWFKVSAPLPLFVDEAAVTAELAERFPGYVPAPLAVEPEHGWLLFAEFDVVGWGEPLETRCELFRRFAGLQRRSVPLVDDLLAAGCLDRRLDVLESQLDPLLADPVAVARLTRAREVGAEAPCGGAEAGLPPSRRDRPAADPRSRRPPSGQHSPARRRAGLLRLDGRVHRAPADRPPLAAMGGRRVGAVGTARRVRRPRGTAPSRPRRSSSPGSSLRSTTRSPTARS